MKVWVVFSGEYEDRDAVAVFSSEDKAVAYIEKCVKEDERRKWGVETYDYSYFDLDAFEVEPTEKRIFEAFHNEPGTLNIQKVEAYYPYYHDKEKDRYFGGEEFDCFVIAQNVSEASDIAINRIRKIESELVAEHGENWRDIKGY